MAASPCGNHLAREGRLARASARLLMHSHYLIAKIFLFPVEKSATRFHDGLILVVDFIRAQRNAVASALAPARRAPSVFGNGLGCLCAKDRDMELASGIRGTKRYGTFGCINPP